MRTSSDRLVSFTVVAVGGVIRPEEMVMVIKATGGDVTVARLLGIAESVCTECRGAEHSPHVSAGYGVTGMQGYAKFRPDCAVAWFGLTRGSVVVRIDGQRSWRWWLPTQNAGEVCYADVRRAVLLAETT